MNIQTVTCERCLDIGTYKHRRCTEKFCDHRKPRILSWKTVTSSRQVGGKLVQFERQIPNRLGRPIMPCPIRVCVCKAGKTYKRTAG